MARQRRATSAVDATARVLRLTAVIWAAAWLITLLVAYLPDPGIVVFPAVTTVALAALVGSWLVLAFARRVPPWPFVAVVGATGLLAAATVQVAGLPGHALFLTTWLNLGAIAAALLLPSRRAAVVIITLASSSLAIIGVRLLGHPGADGAWRSALMASAYCVAVGMAVRVASSVVRQAARRADEEAERARRAAVRQAEQDAHRDEAERMGRLLHDTCINTLGAIRSGVGARLPDALRVRCAADLERLNASGREAVEADRTIADLVTALRAEAQLIGVPAQVTTTTDPAMEVGSDRWVAARGAVREALLNVAKHVPEPRAWVAIGAPAGALTVEVRDAGPGWSGDIEPGRGIDRSIRRRAEATGGALALETGPTVGTCVTVSWPPAPAATDALPQGKAPEPPTDEDLVTRLGLRTVVLGSGTWMLAYAAAATLVFAGVAPFAGSVLALALLGVVLLSVRQSSVAQLPTWTAPLIAVGIAVVVALPGNDGSCLTTNPAAWGPDGAAVLALLACMLGASAWFPASAIAGFGLGIGIPLLVMDGPSAECVETSGTVLLIEVGVVLAISAFRRLLLRTWAGAAESRRRADDADRALSEAVARDRARSARLAWTVGSAGDLLRDIADGAADPSDPDVVDQAARFEGALRSLLALDAAPGPLGDALAEEIAAGLDTGHQVIARAGGSVPSPTADQIADLRTVVATAIGSSPVDVELHLTLFAGRDGGVLTLVTSPAAAAAIAAGPRPSGLDVAVEQFDSEALVSVGWPLPPAGA